MNGKLVMAFLRGGNINKLLKSESCLNRGSRGFLSLHQLEEIIEGPGVPTGGAHFSQACSASLWGRGVRYVCVCVYVSVCVCDSLKQFSFVERFKVSANRPQNFTEHTASL